MANRWFLSQLELEIRASLIGEYFKNGEITRLECFRAEMDAALGEFTGPVKWEKNEDFKNKTM